MQVINWLELQPLPADLLALRERLRAALPLRRLCRLLVETTLRAYPWAGRADLISSYHPSRTYNQGQKIALLIPDAHNVRPTVWQLGQVRYTRVAENPVQGRFQVITVEIHSRQIQMAGGIAGASYPDPDLSKYSPEGLAWLVEWVSEAYAAPLQSVIKKLIQSGQLSGQLAGEVFVPEHASALSPELLDPSFARISTARPWITLEEIYKSLPDLYQLKHQTVLALIQAGLSESSYRSLGAGRWTTPEIFQQLNRDLPQGLPASSLRSSTSSWTKRDEKDLAGYDRKFIPAEARQALEELGVVEKLPEPERSPWRPPKAPVPLPNLSYLHITQAYLPVGAVLHLFAPDVRLVLVQLISGDHQPFLLDRENGLLKAVHPEEMRSRLLKEDIPAGASLWLEYEGNEKYRISLRSLTFKRMVPCKLAHLEDRRLHIEHTLISMMYEGSPSLFKSNLRPEEIDALFAEASRVDLSLREATIYAVQELCAADPDHRAHQLDVLNAVSLQRMCSPGAVFFLLYAQPCFEALGGGYFRYNPTPDIPLRTSRKRKDRLTKLWTTLLSDPVAPNPRANEGAFHSSRLEGSGSPFPTFIPDPDPPSLLREREAEPKIALTALSYAAVEETPMRETALQEEEPLEALLLGSYEAEPFTATPPDDVEVVRSPWRDSFEKLLHSLTELEDPDGSASPVEEPTLEGGVYSDLPGEADVKDSVTFASPFRWEPKPAWVEVPVQTTPPLSNAADPRSLVYIPKIPKRPLHRRPFYQRLFFYLGGWLSRTFGKTP